MGFLKTVWGFIIGFSPQRIMAAGALVGVFSGLFLFRHDIIKTEDYKIQTHTSAVVSAIQVKKNAIHDSPTSDARTINRLQRGSY